MYLQYVVRICGRYFKKWNKYVTLQNFLLCHTFDGDKEYTIVTSHVKFCLQLDNKHSHKSGIKLFHFLILCMYKRLSLNPVTVLSLCNRSFLKFRYHYQLAVISENMSCEAVERCLCFSYYFRLNLCGWTVTYL